MSGITILFKSITGKEQNLFVKNTDLSRITIHDLKYNLIKDDPIRIEYPDIITSMKLIITQNNERRMYPCRYTLERAEIQDGDLFQILYETKCVNSSIKGDSLLIKGEKESDNLVIKDFAISDCSPSYVKENNYAVIIFYRDEIINGKEVKAGSVFFRDTNKFVDLSSNEPGAVHGRAFLDIFGVSLRTCKVVCEGGAVIKGHVRLNSCTFNMDGPYHDDKREMSEITSQMLISIVHSWKTTSQRTFTFLDLMNIKTAELFQTNGGICLCDR